MHTPPEDTVPKHFFQPVHLAMERAIRIRSCPDYSDLDFILSGVRRVLANIESGRAWVQHWQALTQATLSVVNFFESLKSTRRLALLCEIDTDVRQQADRQRTTSDPFTAYRELRDFSIHAADGHFHGASAHEAHDYKGRKRLVEHFFSLNMRTYTLRHLDVAKPIGVREHDLTALRRIGMHKLRMGEPKGRKLIFVYDRAAVDFVQWRTWKDSAGVYMISRAKENMRLQGMAYGKWSYKDPINAGVLSDMYVASFSGVMIRQVLYKDPSTGECFEFLTTEFTLPPGLIALLYRHRWDLEKVFDQLKNKFFERKAWAANDTAKCQQATFCCLAHNLLLLLEDDLSKNHGIRDIKVMEKRVRRIQTSPPILPGASPPITLSRITQRSLQFIRWLRTALDHQTPWAPALIRLRPLMEHYL